MYGLTSSDLETITAVLAQFPQVQEGIIFGSRALGTYKKGSDVDIALKGDLITKIASEISAILNERSLMPYFFDVVDYASLTNENLISHINRVGQTFYTRHD